MKKQFTSVQGHKRSKRKASINSAGAQQRSGWRQRINDANDAWRRAEFGFSSECDAEQLGRF